VERNFSIPTFLNAFLQLVSMPPNAVINDELNNEKLKEFFLSIGMDGINKEDYLQLYDEVEDDEGFNISLHPKPHFNLLIQCFIIKHLMCAGYIQEVFLQNQTEKLFHIGSCIVGVNNKGHFQPLLDDEVLSLLKKTSVDQEIKKILINQLETETLFFLFTYSPNASLMHSLLKKPVLSPLIINNIFDIYMKKRGAFSSISPAVFFENDHPLALEKLLLLIGELSVNQQKEYLKQAIIRGNIAQFEALIPQQLDTLPHVLIILMIKYDRLSMLEKLRSLSFPLDKNLILVHYAVHFERANLFPILSLMGLDFNKADQIGQSPAYIAASKGNIPMLIKLAKHGADLGNIDGEGNTVLHLAAKKNLILNFIESTQLKVYINKVNNYRQTALRLTVQRGNLETALKLLEQGAFPDESCMVLFEPMFRNKVMNKTPSKVFPSN